MHEKKIGKLYMRELGGAMLLYMVLLVASIKFGRPMAEGVLRTLVLASPMLAVGLLIWSVVRHVGRTDEYIRKGTLETIAVSAALTAGLTFTYGFLETAGYPRLSMFVVLPLMFMLHAVLSCGRAWFKR